MSGPQGVVQPRVIAGRYTLLAELGRGGMGVVWRAQDDVIGRHVAIKELHLPDGVPPEERRVLEERVLREARTAGRLNDPAVVTVFDVVAEHGLTYIVMELVEAATLSAIVAQRGPMPQERVAAVAEQVLSALEAAHAAGIVHRDVKPGNLMVRPDGRVKLTDFGIAQAVDDPRLTTSGSLIGSPAYLSPERIQGHAAGPASDLWALGATLCFAVEGYNPYERSSTASTLHAIMNETPRLTRAQGVLAAVISGLLVTDPAVRLSGAQARSLLQHANAGTPPNGTPATVTYTPPGVRPAWRRNLLIAAAAFAAVLLFAAGIYVDRLFFGPPGPPEAMQPTVTYGTGGTLPEFTLSARSCGDDFLGDTVRISSATCTDPHRIEVFADATPFGSAATVPHPGAQRLASYAENLCTMYFTSGVVPVENKDEVFRYAAVVPSQAEWKTDYSASDGERDVYCVLWRTDHAEMDALVADTGK
ncbi:serine/threonine-protein kinase [Umezawaea beigongshangensis]|uniref:serine/threonine-protein kinase n=1 Tax=Umezawaea beigongshangensis TaxID=2780383 RepID=UPI0018F21CF9|nr:serine/threonine-protein kinase [Umezawaea beigongshangensis]